MVATSPGQQMSTCLERVRGRWPLLRLVPRSETRLMPGFGPAVCYWIEPTEENQRWLRRYSQPPSGSAYTCSAGWHTAKVAIDIVTKVEADRATWVSGDLAPHHDPRWPTVCETGCGYGFVEDDAWQLFIRTLYRRGDTEALVTLEDAPPGALWNADWLPADYQGPDGIHLAAKCPNGLSWYVDGPALRPAPGGTTVEGGRWTRSGVPPAVTVSPSIAIGYERNEAGEWVEAPNHYHGDIVDGAFTAG